MKKSELENSKVSVKEFLMRYIAYLPLFIISVGICLFVSYLYLRYTTPYYNVKASILIKSDGSGSSPQDEMFKDLFQIQGSQNVGNETELLKSLTLAKRVVKSLNLQTRYYSIGNVRTSPLYPEYPFVSKPVRIFDSSSSVSFPVKILSHDKFSIGEAPKQYSFNQDVELPGGIFNLEKKDTVFETLKYKDYVVTWDPMEIAAQRVQGELSVVPIKDQSNILLISSQTTHPDLGVAIINRLMDEYQRASVEDKNRIASRAVSFINDRLLILTQELGDVEKNLQQFKQKNEVINIESQSNIYLNNLNDLDKQLMAQEMQLDNIRYLRQYLGDSKNNFNIVPTVLGISEPSLIELVSEYNRSQLTREAQLKNTTPKNPVIQALDANLEKIRVNLLESLKSLEFTATNIRNEQKQKSQSYRSSVSQVPTKEKEMLEITRQQGIKQALYLYLLQKREETAISLASTISNSQVVDAALGSKYPIRPDHNTAKSVAIFIGLLLPLIFIYLRELFNDKVQARQDITRYTDAPILGEISHTKHIDPLVVRANARNNVAEQFRLLRTNLQFMIGQKANQVILVTSTFSGEGKSFVSVNLGAVMAVAGKRTVILEFDIRKPKVVNNLGLTRKQGITQFIVSDVNASELPIPVPGIDNLFVIGCGPIPPNPAEMLLDPKVKTLMDYVKANFDVVIIDTAPSGLVSDAFHLGKFADCCLYLVRFKHTYKKQLTFVDELYTTDKLPKMALVVNDIGITANHYAYGSYGGYGYGYGYGYGISDEQFSRNGFVRFFQKMLRFKKG